MTATCDHLGQVTVIFLDSTVLLTGNCDEEHLISNVCWNNQFIAYFMARVVLYSSI